MYFNPTKGRLFADLALRKAVRSAVNRKLVVGQAYKDTATVATQFYPAGVLPEGAAPDDPAYDPSILAAMVKSLPTKKVDLAYGLSGGTPYRVMAELIQGELQAAGLNVTARGLETSTEFALNTTSDHQRPDLLIEFWGGDAMHPDSDVRIIFRTGAAPLNWFNYSVPAADKVMDAGSAMLNQDAIIKAYAECAKLITDEALFLNLASEYDVFVARRGITNFVHDPQTVQTVRLADLKRG